MAPDPNQDKVHALIRLIYEAAAEPAMWQTFLREFGEAVRASAVGLVVIDAGGGKATVDESVNVDPYYQRSFVEHFGVHNPWTTPAVAHLWTPGSIVDGRDTIADEDFVKTEFYNDFLKPQGWYTAFGSIISQENFGSSYITALRPHSAVPEEGHKLLRILMPHLQTAMRLHERISQLEVTVSALSDAINHLPGGVIIVDIYSRVLVINRTAESILAGNHGLRNGPSGLYASEPGESLALQTTIAAAVRARDGELAAPIPISISRDGSRRPLQILVAPIPPQLSGTRRQPAAVLFIADPDNAQEPSRTLLQSTFSLTEAEARVAAALALGKSVEQISAEFNVTADTVRTHLKKVFSKTDTCRQGELIRLLLTTWSTLRITDKAPD